MMIFQGVVYFYALNGAIKLFKRLADSLRKCAEMSRVQVLAQTHSVLTLYLNALNVFA